MIKDFVLSHSLPVIFFIISTFFIVKFIFLILSGMVRKTFPLLIYSIGIFHKTFIKNTPSEEKKFFIFSNSVNKIFYPILGVILLNYVLFLTLAAD